MSDSTMRVLYILLTGLTPLAALIGAIVGIGTYYTTRRREIAVQLRESQKPFLEKQLQYYFEAIKSRPSSRRTAKERNSRRSNAAFGRCIGENYR